MAHVAYASAACSPLSGEELSGLLLQARRHNARRGVTGILLYHRQSFFQVLEGNGVRVNELYERICKDPRHTNVVKHIQEPIEQRMFGDWTMGFARMGWGELEESPGVDDFFRHGLPFWQLSEGHARSLLSAFHVDRWRRTLEE
ncbi:BLUF domain-containing protein [Dactylosporangium sp. CS-047395]|uniref:BLUF domain-containing protein n=1 Tax=Dactylosporangium sp. CS-047395 TaxID=3239936 RepID=UPI003D923D0E